MTTPARPDDMIAAAPTARAAAAALMQGAAETFTNPDTPAGCLLASSAIACSVEAADVGETLATIRRRVEAALCARIAAEVADGSLSGTTDADALAGLITATIQGMSTLARDGAPRAKLHRIAALALSAWPDDQAKSISPVAGSAK